MYSRTVSLSEYKLGKYGPLSEQDLDKVKSFDKLTPMKTKTLQSKIDAGGNHLQLILDKEKPVTSCALVYLMKGKTHIADGDSWFNVIRTGVLSLNGTKLNDDQCNWLKNQTDEVNSFLFES